MIQLQAYLEDFYKFCQELGGTTADVMSQILQVRMTSYWAIKNKRSCIVWHLQFEADRRAFIITINSFGTELSMDDREKLYPTCGKLHPDGLARLARCEDYDQVKAVADCYPVSQIHHIYSHYSSFMVCDKFHIHYFLPIQEYSAIFAGAGTNPGEKTLEDKFFEKEVIFFWPT